MNYQALIDHAGREIALHVWTCAGALALALVATLLFLGLRSAKAQLSALRSELTETERASARYHEEAHRWRSMFGPFPSLYEDSPESTSEKTNDKTIAIDLDGVILQYVDPWNGINHFGDPVVGAAEAIQKLKDMGYTIVIYTSRNNAMARHNLGMNALHLTALVQNELEKHGIPYDYISMFKPLARVYIDDRAVRFTGWESTLHVVANLEVSRILEQAKLIDDKIGVGSRGPSW